MGTDVPPTSQECVVLHSTKVSGGPGLGTRGTSGVTSRTVKRLVRHGQTPLGEVNYNL